jgi:hypothetical protein
LSDEVFFPPLFKGAFNVSYTMHCIGTNTYSGMYTSLKQKDIISKKPWDVPVVSTGTEENENHDAKDSKYR